MKKLTYSEASICWNNIEAYLWEVTTAVQKQCACNISTAEALAEPLKWYVYTGRASCDFLHKMIKTKPFMIARRLAKGGSTDEAVASIKNFLKVDTSF